MGKTDVKLEGKTILITGIAGFIGSSLARKLYDIHDTIKIVGVDNMNDYYDVSLKAHRLGGEGTGICVCKGRYWG